MPPKSQAQNECEFAPLPATPPQTNTYHLFTITLAELLVKSRGAPPLRRRSDCEYDYEHE